MRGDATREVDADTQDYVDYVSTRLERWHRAAFLLCGDRHRADDLVQTTMTKLYVHWARARAADKIDGYVHRMLVRAFLDERRLAWSKVWLMPATPEPDTASDSALEDRDLVVRALEELPKGQRTVLVMRFLCDMPVEQVAAAMRCSTGNVKAQTFRGLAALRERLGDEFAGAMAGRARGVAA
ncbi:SigE family RNA polymerase sigma factor [Micromonospora sp. CPCC 206061]|uniref:SigE family RNA polymerase sigma factor n=1 Tax=Micromonospora sp. CPCC 206061 TaxID=3122410 RepID=UPI002FF38199